jgi:Ser/Thr protein kinase RdoA (MazF antagonist)
MEKIAQHFDIEGLVTEVRPLGNGLINDTYLVSSSEGKRYVLQRINHSIFKDVDLLQRNIAFVTSHIRAKLIAAGEEDIERKVLRFLSLKGSDSTYYTDGESYWRMSAYIEDSVTVETVTPESSYCAGKAFGEFQAMLVDIKEPIGETIPDFHNMELRARQLREAVATDAVGRCSEPEICAFLSEIDLHIYEMCKAERLHREGVLPKRICHCDTKVSNMLFDKDGSVLCVIDLDTLMPSFIFSDVGDFLRTAANYVAEDCPEIDKVGFNMEIFRSFISGYLESAGSFLTEVERENLPYAAALFPFMQAVRFLTDYINGDTYYKIAYPEHNLVRTRNQMALFRSVLSHMDQMQAIVSE